MFIEMLLNKKVHVQYFIGSEKLEAEGHLAKEDDNFIYLSERNQFIKISSIASIFEIEDNEEESKIKVKSSKSKKKVKISAENEGEESIIDELNIQELGNADVDVKPKNLNSRKKLSVPIAKHSVAITNESNFNDGSSTFVQNSDNVHTSDITSIKSSKTPDDIVNDEAISNNNDTKKQHHIPTKVGLTTNTPANFTLIQCSTSIRKAEARRLKAEEEARLAEEANAEAARRALEEAEKNKPHVPHKVDLTTNAPANFTLFQCSTSIRKAEAKRLKAEEEARLAEEAKAEAERRALEEAEKNKPHVPHKVDLTTNAPANFTLIQCSTSIRKAEARRLKAEEEARVAEKERIASEKSIKEKEETEHKPKVVTLIKTEPANFAVHRNRISELVQAASRALVNPLSDPNIPQKAADPMTEEFSLGKILPSKTDINQFTGKKLSKNNTQVSVAIPLDDGVNTNPPLAEDKQKEKMTRAEAAVKRVFGHSSALLKNNRRTVQFAPTTNFSFKSTKNKEK